jgi:predicted nucleotidyltransferase
MRSRDYEEFVASLNESGARYLIVGAHAVAFHARPRATKDLDVFIEPTPENAGRVLAAIRSFLGSDLGLTVADLTALGRFVQLGVAPARIDLLSGLAGRRDFASAWETRVDAKFGDVDAHYLSLDDLIREKESAGRDQDRADLRSLRKAREKRGG